MSWTVVEFPVSEQVSEAAAERMRAAGADGVAEEWRKERTYVRGFWQHAEAAQAVDATTAVLRLLVEVGLLTEVPALSVTSMEEQDWLEGWKQYFSPFEISERLAVTPSWETFTPRDGQQVITLDPGMAFGTGTHGTTYMCLRALSDYLQPGMHVCDVGTGSGILAIGAVKLGAGLVVATDNDTLAVRVARDNADMNGVAERIDFQVADLTAGLEGPYDLLLANILAPIIRQLIPRLSSIVASQALFISSGYITGQEAEIRAALEGHGFRVMMRYEREDWVTLVTQRE
jgi:ribosomal protein L11 methyltransferase